MKTGKKYSATIKSILNGKKCPLDISVIPNYMGINLNSVKKIEWKTNSKKELKNINIVFKTRK